MKPKGVSETNSIKLPLRQGICLLNAPYVYNCLNKAGGQNVAAKCFDDIVAKAIYSQFSNPRAAREVQLVT